MNMTGYPIVCLTDSALLPFWKYSPSLWFIRKLFQKILQFEVYHSSCFQVILLLKANKLIRFPASKVVEHRFTFLVLLSIFINSTNTDCLAGIIRVILKP